MNRRARQFLERRGVLEVETSALSSAGNTDPHIDSLIVNCGQELRYLHSSPEYAMKRLLCHGSGDIYQISKVWRAEESGRLHNPEFTLLEYYRVGFELEQLMLESQQLLEYALQRSLEVQRYTYAELFKHFLNIDDLYDRDQLQKAMQHTALDNTDALSSQAMRDYLLSHEIEPQWSDDSRLIVVYDYPAEQCALASMIERDGHQVALRFELYLQGVEIANAYQEQTHAQCNGQQLHKDQQQRYRQGLSSPPLDQHFLRALDQGLPKSCGIAIGLDRLLMIALGQNNIQSSLAYPWSKA